MNFLDNPKRWFGARGCGVLVALLCAVAVTGTAFALTGRDTPEQTRSAEPTQPSTGELTAIKQLLLNPLAMPDAVREAVHGSGEPTLRASRKFKPSIYASAIDGEFAYLVRTTRSIDSGDIENVPLGTSTEIVRQNISTGATARIFQANNSLVTGIAASNGSVVASVIRVSEGRRSIAVDSTTLSAGPTSESMTVTATRRMKVGSDFEFCGSLLLVVGIADDGNALASDVTGGCKNDEEFNNNQVMIRPPDSIAVLAADQPLTDVVLAKPKVVSGRLLNQNHFRSGFGITELSNSKFTNLWNGQSYVADLATDGTVALIGRPQAYEFFGFFLPATYERKLPLMRFPQGDPDQAQMLARSAGKIMALKFCGSDLYALKPVPSKRRSRPRGLGEQLELVANSMFGYRAFDVLAYGETGEPVRTAGRTPAMHLSSLGCTGDGIVLAAARGNRASYLRYK